MGPVNVCGPETCTGTREDTGGRSPPPSFLVSHELAKLAILDDDAARLVAEPGDGHRDRVRGQKREKLVRPLDHGHAVAVQEILDTDVEQLGEGLGAIRIQVIDGQPPSVVVDEHEGRARHHGLDAEPPGEALEEAGLAGSEVPDAGDHRARLEARPQVLAQRLRLFGTSRDHGLQGLHERRLPREGVMAAGIASMMSPAMSESSPRSAHARSPARPWRKQPAWSAASASSPRARNAPTMPVRTSPEPPLAMPGLPVGLMKTRPSGPPITVPAPLSASATRCRAQNVRTVSSRSACTSATVAPSILPISPGWGVSARGPAARSSRSRCPPSALRASASITIGRSTSATSPRISSWVSGSSERPGPSATASVRAASSRRRSLAFNETVWPAVSASGSVICSMPRAATMGCCEAGVAMVQRPTPLRSAARPVRAAAPVLPTDPAITSRWPKLPLWASGCRGGK